MVPRLQVLLLLPLPPLQLLLRATMCLSSLMISKKIKLLSYLFKKQGKIQS